MGNVGACTWCRTGRYINDPRKFFRDSHLCYDCSIIGDLMVQHLVPASERKTTARFGRSGAYKPIPFNSNLGALAKTRSIREKIKANDVDPVPSKEY